MHRRHGGFISMGDASETEFLGENCPSSGIETPRRRLETS